MAAETAAVSSDGHIEFAKLQNGTGLPCEVLVKGAAVGAVMPRVRAGRSASLS
jgi:hypothetical protein